MKIQSTYIGWDFTVVPIWSISPTYNDGYPNLDGVGPTPTIYFTVSVVLQGSNRPDTGWIVPLTVKLFTPGGNIMSESPVYTFNLTTSKLDSTAIAAVTTPIVYGSYDITTKASGTLTNVKYNIDIEASDTVTMGTLLEGDIMDIGAVNAVAYSALIESYLTSVGQPGYIQNADMTLAGTINSIDYSLLIANYLEASPIGAE
jgi:hypothetical protein